MARLDRNDWVERGLATLESDGYAGLKAERVAEALGVSRGSFYWHFKDVADYQAAILQRWREQAFAAVVRDVEMRNEHRLHSLLIRALSARSKREIAIRAWAALDERAAEAVRVIDDERIAYICKLLLEEGVEPTLALVRARLLNWIYLGHVLATDRTSDSDRGVIVDELFLLFNYRNHADRRNNP